MFEAVCRAIAGIEAGACHQLNRSVPSALERSLDTFVGDEIKMLGRFELFLPAKIFPINMRINFFGTQRF